MYMIQSSYLNVTLRGTHYQGDPFRFEQNIIVPSGLGGFPRYTRPLEEVVSRIAKVWGSKLGRLEWHTLSFDILGPQTFLMFTGAARCLEIFVPRLSESVDGAQGWTRRARRRTRRTFCWKATLLRCCHGPDLQGCEGRAMAETVATGATVMK